MSDVASPAGRLLPVGGIGRKGVGWWGLLTVIVTEGALFGYLLFSYLYFAIQLDPSWLPELPSLGLSLPNTVVLLASSGTAWWAEKGIRRGARRQLLAGLTLSILLGMAFLGIQLVEWHNQHFSLSSSSYGSFFYTITGFHMMHVAVGVVMLLMVLLWSSLGYFDARRHTPVLIVIAYWHFVDAVWIAVFATLYITPRLG